MRLRVQSLALFSGLRIRRSVSCGLGRRRSLDSALLWLWCGLAAAAPTRPLAWEPPYAVGTALEKAKRQKKKKRRTQIFHVLLAIVYGRHVITFFFKHGYWDQFSATANKQKIIYIVIHWISKMKLFVLKFFAPTVDRGQGSLPC